MTAAVEEQLATAGTLLAAGDIDTARTVLDAVIEQHDDPAAHQLRGFIHYMDDHLDEVRRDWEAAFQGFRERADFARAARAAMGLAELHTGSLGHEAAGQGWLGRARRLLDRVGPCVEHGWFEIALMACSRPNVDDLLESAERALEIALEYGDVDLEVRALADGGLALVSQGHVREGFERLDEALAAITAGRLREPSTAGLAFCSMLSSCDRSGDLARAEEWNRLIDELILDRLRGRPIVLHTHCQVAYGSVLFCAGRWQEAEAVMLDALGPKASRSVGHRIEVSARLAELRIHQGRVDEAAQLIAAHAEHVVMCTPRASAHFARGEDDLAVAVAMRGLDEFVGDTVRRAPLLAVAVQAELRRGDLDAAGRFASDLAALTEEGDSPALDGEAQLARGRLAMAKGDASAATAALRTAARSFERAERPLQSAIATLELGEAHEADGNRANAIVEARAAHAVFTRLGAKPLADRAAAMLRALGDLVRVRPVDAGAAVGSLTRRETEVLALIREGLSNPEIAERLFISAKTAEHHVGRVLAKLGVKSRAEAAALATATVALQDDRGNGGPP